MKKHRIFDKFGFDFPKQKKPTMIITMLRNYKELFYDLKSEYWVEIDGALNLSGYQPPQELLAILQNNISNESGIN